MTVETYVCSLSPLLGCRGNNSSEIGHRVTATLSPGLHSRLLADGHVCGVSLHPGRQVGTPSDPGSVKPSPTVPDAETRIHFNTFLSLQTHFGLPGFFFFPTSYKKFNLR